MKIVPPWQVWPLRELAISSLTLGFGLFLLSLCSVPFVFVNWPGGGVLPSSFVIIWTIVNLVLWPLIAMRHCRAHLSTIERRLFAIAWTSIGFFVLPYTATIVALSGNLRVFSWQLPALHGAILAAWVLLAAIAWPIIRHRWPFVIQDGSSCPQCGYCVRGVASAVCPECGTAFDHTQLGLSLPEFDRLIAGGVHKRRPAGLDRHHHE